ncbi:MAG: hypothetical protein NT096_00140 [Proteobacteria bacterium]|nr:hypothetical protein [Pseudomonadota bacterium]
MMDTVTKKQVTNALAPVLKEWAFRGRNGSKDEKTAYWNASVELIESMAQIDVVINLEDAYDAHGR